MKLSVNEPSERSTKEKLFSRPFRKRKLVTHTSDASGGRTKKGIPSFKKQVKLSKDKVSRVRRETSRTELAFTVNAGLRATSGIQAIGTIEKNKKFGY